LLPDFQKEFIIESDVSGQDTKAILIQDGKPIVYFSKLYLLGWKFTVRTDKKSLRQLFLEIVTMMNQQNWAGKFLGCRFDIEYKPSHRMVILKS